MAVTKEMWEAREKERAHIRHDPRPIHEGLLRQAAVSASLLTGHPGWDKYLQTLQADVETAEAEQTRIHETLVQPMTVEALRMAYVNLNVVTERLRVLRYCMTLPKEILAHAADTLDKSDQ